MEKLLEAARQSPRTVILMSGKGSNADNILRHRRMYESFNFVTVFSDQPESNAKNIAEKHMLGFCIESFDRHQESRQVYFQRVTEFLRTQEVSLLIYAGFMKIVPAFFAAEFPGVNIHPSDLTIISEDGKPKYRGMRALSQAVSAGENSVASTVHLVDIDVDCGQAIAVTEPYPVSQLDLLDIGSLHERLKIEREHTFYPQVLALLERGKIEVEDMPLSYVRVRQLLDV